MVNEAIIVVDMLNGFLKEDYPLYCGDEAREIIPRVASLLRSYHHPGIIYVCDSHAEDDPEFKMFPRHCVAGTDEAEIIDELRDIPGEVIIKSGISAFYGTRLDGILEDIKPGKVVVVGVCTDICVRYTVAGLRFRGFQVEVPADCVASFDKGEHESALNHIEKVLGATITRQT